MGRILKGDIVVVNFEPIKGSEQGGLRPALIIQNNILNKYSPTTIVAPLTSRKQFKSHLTNIPISKKDSKLKSDSTILLNQIRTIDKSRIKKRISRLNSHLMFEVDNAIKTCLELD